MSFYRTWPTHWLRAAVAAGLARDYGVHGYWFESDELRGKLEHFAKLIENTPREPGADDE